MSHRNHQAEADYLLVLPPGTEQMKFGIQYPRSWQLLITFTTKLFD